MICLFVILTAVAMTGRTSERKARRGLEGVLRDRKVGLTDRSSTFSPSVICRGRMSSEILLIESSLPSHTHKGDWLLHYYVQPHPPPSISAHHHCCWSYQSSDYSALDIVSYCLMGKVKDERCQTEDERIWSNRNLL